MIEIDKEIPIPEHREYNKYPFRDMGVGDSFLVNIEPGEDYSRTRKRVESAASGFRRRNPGRKFIIRKEGSAARIWRIK